MTVFAIVDEAGLETGLDPGHDAFIDIALAGLAPRRLDVDIDQLLAIDDRDAQLFRVRRIEQHAFHSKPPTRASSVVRGASGSTQEYPISAQGASGQNASGSGAAPPRNDPEAVGGFVRS